MFLLRLDDASEYWNASRWNRMHGLLKQYGVRPLVAVIPKNEDPKLRAFGKDDKFWETFQNWMKQDGWSPALHGFNHVLDMKTGGGKSYQPLFGICGQTAIRAAGENPRRSVHAQEAECLSASLCGSGPYF